MRLRWSWRRFELLKRSAQSFEEVASSSNNVLTITGMDDPESLRVEIVSPGSRCRLSWAKQGFQPAVLLIVGSIALFLADLAG